ncbi:MAG: hypothetical protein IJK84_03170 [Bacteroidales bacterium]|nr:hypothetical protein [Bacteroidales bacterium]
MKLRKNSLRTGAVAVLMLLAFNSCKKFQGDVTVPAFIHIGSIDVVRQSVNAPSNEDGFYTSNIDVVELVCFFEGDESETRLGAFELPCTVPILRHGKMKYLTINPAVKLGGVSGAHIDYPFYQPIRLEDVPLSAEDTTYLGTFDEASGDYKLYTSYYSKGSMLRVLAECYFEPTSFSTCFDSNMTWVTNDPAGACTGQGYGKVHVPDSMRLFSFGFTDSTEFDPGNSRVLYMELEYKTDLPLYVHMLGYSTTEGSTITSKSVMCINPKNQWNKMYVNLGRTWSQFYYRTPIRVYFQAVNEEGVEGDILIDNIKVICTQ